jgi:hypothetical protein
VGGGHIILLGKDMVGGGGGPWSAQCLVIVFIIVCTPAYIIYIYNNNALVKESISFSFFSVSVAVLDKEYNLNSSEEQDTINRTRRSCTFSLNTVFKECVTFSGKRKRGEMITKNDNIK